MKKGAIVNLHRIVSLALAAGLSAPCQANSYRLVDLGQHMQPRRINETGEIAGIDMSKPWHHRAVVWRGHRWHQLAAETPGFAYSVADDGRVAGTLGNVPVVWTRGGSALGFQLPEGAVSGELRGDAGPWAAGSYRVASGQAYCFIAPAAGGDAIPLGTLEGGSNCLAMGSNRAGQVTGFADNGQTTRAFLWSEGVMSDLGALAADAMSIGYALNDAGVVVGSSDTGTGTRHAVSWQQGTIQDLDPGGLFPFSEAWGISHRGQIVGTVGVPAQRIQVAVRFEGGRPVPLQPEVTGRIGHWQLAYAWSANDAGVIVGWGLHNGYWHGFMLVPRSAP